MAPEEFSLLVKRYERHAYTVNYVAFVKDIEDTQNFMDEYGMLHVSGANEKIIYNFIKRKMIKLLLMLIIILGFVRTISRKNYNC